MKVALLHHTPLHIVAGAIRTCWASQARSDSTVDTCGPEDRALIDRIGNKMKHESFKNHMTYNFCFEGMTTKTLLALTRHDVGVEFSVQSTRYTTKKVVNNNTAGYTQSKSDRFDEYTPEELTNE